MGNNIFTIERRVDFSKAYKKCFDDISNTTVNIKLGFHSSKDIILLQYLERCLQYWPYRMGAVGFEDYFSQIGIDFYRTEKEQEQLLVLELFINLLHWAPKHEVWEATGVILLEGEELTKETNRILGNIEFILEKACNMRIREEYDTKQECIQYMISKRDETVDAVLETVPSLYEQLLGYLDIRNKEDKEYKRKTIEELYAFMEPNRKKYKALSCSAISEEFFVSVNSFGIRHNTKSQIQVHPKKMIKIYDNLFKMGIYVLQTEKVNSYKDELQKNRS